MKIKVTTNQARRGAVTTEAIMLVVVVVVALITCASSVRDSLNSELTDAGLAIQAANQTIEVRGVQTGTSFTSGSGFTDALDVNDGADNSGEMKGITFNAPEDGFESLDSLLQSLDFTFTMRRGGSTWTNPAEFDEGNYIARFWRGTYTISGTTITISLNPLTFWSNGTIILDASDPRNMTGTVSWENNRSGFIWTADYDLNVN